MPNYDRLLMENCQKFRILIINFGGKQSRARERCHFVTNLRQTCILSLVQTYDNIISYRKLIILLFILRNNIVLELTYDRYIFLSQVTNL